MATDLIQETDMSLRAGVDLCGAPSYGDGETGELGRTELIHISYLISLSLIFYS